MIESPAQPRSLPHDHTQHTALAPTAAVADLTIPHQRRGSVHPTKVVLRALAAALCDQPVPSTLDSSEDRQRVAEIGEQQLAAAWRQLRSRYPTALVAARELHTATIRAAGWVNTLLEPCGPDRRAFEPARLALIATVTRRLVVDGIAIARGAVDHCQQTVSWLDGDNGAAPSNQDSH